jgi:hypothetical protein
MDALPVGGEIKEAVFTAAGHQALKLSIEPDTFIRTERAFRKNDGHAIAPKMNGDVISGQSAPPVTDQLSQ